MCLAQGPQRSDTGEARTRCPSVLSQALYHWATALPKSSTMDQMLCKGLFLSSGGHQSFQLSGSGWTILVEGLLRNIGAK